ncbi:hypothetical protein V8G54_019375 [Vigna mungo]|uniref:RING-type E3 ubiquitin transferase n=1 Tax=Vigna mungo TaxID=3915 RepID=A0AAQ3NA09_VIGMU
MHNLHPPAFREFPSYMRMDTNDMSYETLYNVHEFPSLGDPHSNMHLDIDGMSYEELLELSEWINDNSERGLSEDIIVRHMQTKSYLLPENLEDQESNICIICQDEYKNKEEIGILQCGHEYHAECILNEPSSESEYANDSTLYKDKLFKDDDREKVRVREMKEK